MKMIFAQKVQSAKRGVLSCKELRFRLRKVEPKNRSGAIWLN